MCEKGGYIYLKGPFIKHFWSIFCCQNLGTPSLWGLAESGYPLCYLARSGYTPYIFSKPLSLYVCYVLIWTILFILLIISIWQNQGAPWEDLQHFSDPPTSNELQNLSGPSKPRPPRVMFLNCPSSHITFRQLLYNFVKLLNMLLPTGSPNKSDDTLLSTMLPCQIGYF